MIQAIHDADLSPSRENAKKYGLWKSRCDLFGLKEVIYYAKRMIETNDELGIERTKVFDGLPESMRKDLGN